MKKRKVNPSSNVAKVLDLMKADAKVSVKEIVAKTGLNTKTVYVIRNYIKKHGLLGGAKPKVNKAIAKQQTADEKEIENILKENKTLTDWTVMWRRKCDSLESELNRVRHLYMDQLAVVRYLEAKLMQFVEANLSEKEKS